MAAIQPAAFLLVPSELLLSAHSPTPEGWTAELTVGSSLVVPTTGFEPTRVDLTRFETLRLNHSSRHHTTYRLLSRFCTFRPLFIFQMMCFLCVFHE